MEALSSSHYSVDGQLEDAVSYLEHNEPELYAQLIAEFPEWETRTMDSAWFDTDVMGVDVEWSSWIIDWVEQNTRISWDDGEPYLFDDGDAYPVEDWQYEVANGDTLLGYAEWVTHQIEASAED